MKEAELGRQTKKTDLQKLKEIEDDIRRQKTYYFDTETSKKVIDLSREKLQIENRRKKKPLSADEIEYKIYKSEATRGIVIAQHTLKYAKELDRRIAKGEKIAHRYHEATAEILAESKALDDHAESIRKGAVNELLSSTASPKKVFEPPVRSQKPFVLSVKILK